MHKKPKLYLTLRGLITSFCLLFLGNSVLLGCQNEKEGLRSQVLSQDDLCQTLRQKVSLAENAQDWIQLTQWIEQKRSDFQNISCLLEAGDEILAGLKSQTFQRSEMRTAPQVVNALEEAIYELRHRSQSEGLSLAEVASQRKQISYRSYLLNVQKAIRSGIDLQGNLVVEPEGDETYLEHLHGTMKQLGKTITSIEPTDLLAVSTEIVRTHINQAYFFSRLGTKDLITRLSETIPGEKDATKRGLLKKRLKKMKKEKYSIGRLENTLFQYLVVEWKAIDAEQYSALWKRFANERRNGIAYRHLFLKEGDIWLQTSSDSQGPGDLMAQITNFPGFTNHAGVVGMEVEDNLPIYYKLNMSLRLEKEPLDFQHHIFVRSNRGFRPGITTRSIWNLKRFPKFTFDSLFIWGIEPVQGTSYIYCTEFIHFMFATEFAKKEENWDLSPYKGAELYATWGNAQVEKNAAHLGYTDDMPILFSAPLFFSPSTDLVGASFEKSRPRWTESEQISLRSKKIYQDEVVKALGYRSLKKTSRIKETAANLALSAAGLLVSSPIVRTAIPHSLMEPLLLVETFDFSDRDTVPLLGFFAGIQLSIMKLGKKTGNLNLSTFDEAEFVPEHVTPLLENLFEDERSQDKEK